MGKIIWKGLDVPIAIMFLALLLSISSAAAGALDITMTSPIVIDTLIVIGIAFVLIAIGFMVTRAFALQQWEVWLKQEWASVLFSAVLLVLFVVFSTAADAAARQLANDTLSSSIQSATGGSVEVTHWTINSVTGRWVRSEGAAWDANSCESPCYFYIAKSFLGSTYEKYAEMLAKKKSNYAVGGYDPYSSLGYDVNKYSGIAPLYSDSLLYESFAMGGGMSLRLAAATLSLRFALPSFAGRAILNNSLEMTVNLMIKAMGSLKFQEMVLAVFQSLAGALFIAGIIFRVPWFTRKLGGLLIACAIGIYFIYPLVYVMGWYVVDRTTIDLVSNVPIQDPSVTDIFSAQGSIEKSADMLFTRFPTATDPSGQIGLFDIVSRTYIPTLMIPVLAIFITIGFVRHFSPMIGGDPEIAGLTHMI